jgi:alkylation response protein AidB-like acyl-CoA dehydrogenase
LKDRLLPRCATGECSPAFALSEPEAGSDPGAMLTRAVRDDGEWVITGTKNWITNLGIADFYVVFAVTDPRAGHSRGMTAFVVEADRPGFSIGKLEHKLGIRGSTTAQLYFDDCRLPESRRLGAEGQGWRVAMSTLDSGRIGIAAQSVGMARAALDYAIGYAKERQAFGKRVIDFQNTRFRLAEAKTEARIARVFVEHCIDLLVAGRLDVETAAMAKWWTTQKQCEIIDSCLQFHGGYGYMMEYPIARMWTDARAQKIYGGTNEIMKELIARGM